MLRALIELEEKKKRNSIADELRRLLPRTGAGGENDKALEYLAETTPQVSLHDLQLQPAVRDACEELILEQQKADVLARAGIRPRNRILLTGPPGNGKTSMTEAIAAALGRPFYTVTYDTLTGEFLGQTGSRLRKVFEYVTSHDCVVLFDEFEGIGKERDDRQEVGELKRVVASMLLQMDQAPPGTVIAAATNHPEMLDRAAWRRFQIRLELERPSRNALARYFEDCAAERRPTCASTPPRPQTRCTERATQKPPSSSTTSNASRCSTPTKTRPAFSDDGWTCGPETTNRRMLS